VNPVSVAGGFRVSVLPDKTQEALDLQERPQEKRVKPKRGFYRVTLSSVDSVDRKGHGHGHTCSYMVPDEDARWDDAKVAWKNTRKGVKRKWRKKFRAGFQFGYTVGFEAALTALRSDESRDIGDRKDRPDGT